MPEQMSSIFAIHVYFKKEDQASLFWLLVFFDAFLSLFVKAGEIIPGNFLIDLLGQEMGIGPTELFAQFKAADSFRSPPKMVQGLGIPKVLLINSFHHSIKRGFSAALKMASIAEDPKADVAKAKLNFVGQHHRGTDAAADHSLILNDPSRQRKGAIRRPTENFFPLGSPGQLLLDVFCGDQLHLTIHQNAIDIKTKKQNVRIGCLHFFGPHIQLSDYVQLFAIKSRLHLQIIVKHESPFPIKS